MSQVPEGQVTLAREGPVARITFDRPHARNAMTWAMYEQLDRAAAALGADESVRVVVMRGAGGRAFVAGSDIAQFTAFSGAGDGIEYEAKMDRYAERLLAIPVPVVCVIEGWAVGGGLGIAACADIRIASQGSRFGVPIARTIGNCLSMATYARLARGFGDARARRMLMLAEFIDADEALAAGFLARVAPREELDAAVDAVVATLLENAPLTLRVTKEALSRVARGEHGPADDLVSTCYGSADFQTGVAAFIAKSRPDWQGR